LASAEFEKLGDLDRPEFKDMNTHQSLVPFELRILHATLPAYLKYPSLTLERVTLLAVYCKKQQRKNIDAQLWKHREMQTYLVLATHLIGIKDFSAAATTMQLILIHMPDNIDILSSLGRLYLQMGDLTSAKQMFARMEELYGENDTAKEAVETNKAFVLMAQGDWAQAKDILQQVYQNNSNNLLAINNLAVCEVYLGNLSKVSQIYI
jgi:Flp pilus assembly protein TadD